MFFSCFCVIFLCFPRFYLPIVYALIIIIIIIVATINKIQAFSNFQKDYSFTVLSCSYYYSHYCCYYHCCHFCYFICFCLLLILEISWKQTWTIFAKSGFVNLIIDDAIPEHQSRIFNRKFTSKNTK